jgi:hypothetical protein
MERIKETAPKCFLDLFKNIFLKNSEQSVKEIFLKEIKNPKNLEFRTQYRTSSNGIPDLVIFKDGKPICLIENKHASPIGSPGIENKKDQLGNYGCWLRKKSPIDFEPALILLTHFTTPPPGFVDSSCTDYGTKLRSVAYWPDVANWFKELSENQSEVNERLKLSRENFIIF